MNYTPQKRLKSPLKIFFLGFAMGSAQPKAIATASSELCKREYTEEMTTEVIF